uniref:Lipase n=1 Tax=Acrobeloides nanus TaxID=290746 RepID=A0A914EG39_9BILA
MLKLFSTILVLLAISKSFGNDPEEYMDVPQIIEYWGYPAETVEAVTADGYILDLHRIPWNKEGNDGKKKPVVFLQHGLECSSSNWVTNLPNESAAFIFSDAGFDVWMGNMRGNTYGKNHVTLDPNSHEFWQFSWDDMVKYDLDALINTVLNATGQPYLYYVGHSQGTLTMFSKLSVDANFHSKIKQFHALAPVGTVKYIKGLLEYIAKFFYSEFDILFDILGAGEFTPNNWVMDLISDYVCGNFIGNPLCDSILFLIAGPESNQFNQTRIQIYLTHTPAGTSTQNIIHWAQMVLSGQVEMYDYQNAKDNQNHYGQAKPPLYDFTKINGDIYLYWSPPDWLATEKDIEEFLLPTLNPNIIKGNNKLEDFNHLDFIWGLRAPSEVYEPIIDVIKADLGAQAQQASIKKSDQKH